MRAYIGYLSAVHNYYAVSVLNGRDTLCYDDSRGIGKLFAESGSYRAVRCGIDCARGVVKNDYLRLFEERARDTESLLLTFVTFSTPETLSKSFPLKF